MFITFNKICLVLTYNAESPTARQGTTAIIEMETVYPDFATLGSVASLAAPGRPNKKRVFLQIRN